MKSLNVRLVIILVIALLVVTGAVWGIHRLQVRHNAGFFITESKRALERAEAAKKQGDVAKEKEEFKSAVENLAWYLRLRPEDTDQLQELGLLLADRGYDKNSDTILDPRLLGQAYITLEKVMRQSV